MKKVTMYDLGQSLSKVIRAARVEPILVCKYAQPFVWIVPYGACIHPDAISRLIPDDHPLRIVRFHVDQQLACDVSAGMRVTMCGTVAIPADVLFRGVILQVIYAIAEPLQLYRQLGYNLLFRWFVGLDAWQELPQEDGFTNALRSMQQDVNVLRKVGEVIKVMQPHLQRDDTLRDSETRIQEWLARLAVRAGDNTVEELALR